MLYEACGRMVNPIYGSVGLLWSGQWQLCQNAVEAVLKGAPITPIPTEAAANSPPIQAAYDIRHVSKDEHANSNSSAGSHKVKPTRTRFKRTGSKRKPTQSSAASLSALQMMAAAAANADTESTRPDSAELNGSSMSHDSTVSHPDEPTSTMDMTEVTADVCDVADQDNVRNGGCGGGDGEVELDLTLGFRFDSPIESKSRMVSRGNTDQSVVCGMKLGLV